MSGDRHSAAAAREEPPILALLADLKTAIASRILVVLCATAIAFCVVGAVLVAIVNPGATTRWVALILGLLATLSALELWRTARPWAGLRVFYALVALALGYAILENGGIDAPAFYATIPLTLALAFAFRPRVAGIAVALVVAWTVFVEWAKRAGVIASAPPLAPWARITAGAMLLAWVVTLASAPYSLLRSAVIESAEREAEARESEDRFAVLSQAAFEGIAFTEKGVILEVNDQLAELLGFDRTELVGRKVLDMIAPRSRALVDSRIRALSEEPYEHDLLHKDGTPIPVESRARRMPFRGRIVRVTAIRDMRDRKKAERELKQSEELLRLALEGARMGIWVLDVRTGSVQRLPEKPWFYDREPPPTLADFLERVHPDDREATAQAVADCIEGRTPYYDHVMRLLQMDGSVRWVESKGQVFRDPDGLPERMAGTVVDISERKRVEESLRESEERYRALAGSLERTVTERTAELLLANRELEAFAYSVSHDLRSPLRAINAFSRILADEHAEDLGPTGIADLERIRAAGTRMDELIVSLLDLSRIARADLRRSPVDLSALASSIGSELARSRPSHVELVVEPGLEARADASLVRIALTNLLDNAWKFTAKTEAPRVEVGAVRSGPEAPVFFVRDNGAGFDPGHANDLFLAFRRLHAPHEFPGTGIGLATVQRIVSRHGGRIWAESAVGQGATFFFTLPAIAARAPV